VALTFYRAIGLFGAAIYVVAYFANQARRLKSEDWRFPAANLAGALLILVSLSAEWNLPSVVIEAFWAAISVYGLVNRA
jgi:ABC-type molybdate transport system permease subunit